MKKIIDIRMFNECRGAHLHDFIQLMVPLEKSMWINIEGQEYYVTPQELCLVPMGAMHECNFYGRMLVLNMTELPEGEKEDFFKYPFIISMRGQIVQLVQLIQSELKQNPDSTSVRFLYQYLYNKLVENFEPESIRYIHEHYDLPITVEQLAEMECYNVTYYNDWFKRQTGSSPGMFLRQTRVRKAKELLINTNYSVTRIAMMVGYSCNSTFTRAFRNITNMTPKAYRRQMSIIKKHQLDLKKQDLKNQQVI